METCNQDNNYDISQPIAIGPCMFYKRYPKRKRLSLGSLLTKSWRKSHGDKRGHWVDSFLTLYMDSTVCLQDGSSDRCRVVASVKLVDVYKQLLFGGGITSSALDQDVEVPVVDNKHVGSLLALPTNADDSNSPLTWLFFFSQHTLNKWLVAFCRSIPAEMLNETGVLHVCHQWLKQFGKASPSLALKNHIRLFFPSSDVDPSAAGYVTAGVRINTVLKRAHQDKKQTKRPRKGLRDSRSKKK